MNGDELSASWGNKAVKLVGAHVITLAFMLLVLIAVGFLIHKHQEDTEQMYNELFGSVQKRQAEFSERQREVIEILHKKAEQDAAFQGEIIYMMTLSEAERQRLGLQIPPSLRSRMRER